VTAKLTQLCAHRFRRRRQAVRLPKERFKSRNVQVVQCRKDLRRNLRPTSTTLFQARGEVMTRCVQLPVQLACNMRATSVSATPCLPISKLHACTRAARLLHGIGIRKGLDRPPHAGMHVDNQQPKFHTIARGCLPGPAADLNHAIWHPARYLTHREAERIQRLPIGPAAHPIFPASGYQNRSRTAHIGPLIRAFHPCARATSAFRQCSTRSEGVLARVSNHTFHSVEAVERAREGQVLGATEALAIWQSRFIRIGLGPPLRSSMVGGKYPSRPMIEVFACIRGPFLENLGGPVFKNLAAACSGNSGPRP
jgi:hypothetical protein